MPQTQDTRAKFHYSTLPQWESQGEFLLRTLFARLDSWDMRGFSWQPVLAGTAVVWHETLIFQDGIARCGQASGVNIWPFAFEKLVGGIPHFTPAKFGEVRTFELRAEDRSYPINVLRTERQAYFQWDEPVQVGMHPLGYNLDTGQPSKTFNFTEDMVFYLDYVPPASWWKFWIVN